MRSGPALVEGTRIGVHGVAAMIRTGVTVDEVVSSLPSLSRAQVYGCVACDEDHLGEIDPVVAELAAHLDK